MLNILYFGMFTLEWDKAPSKKNIYYIVCLSVYTSNICPLNLFGWWVTIFKISRGVENKNKLTKYTNSLGFDQKIVYTIFNWSTTEEASSTHQLFP